jgi:outer membrane receptor protein involved in Fe transport
MDWQQAQSMEVVRGPTSLLYGSQALGGVINFTTRPAPKKTEWEIEDLYGSFGYNRLGITGGTGNNKGGLRISAQDSTFGGYRDNSGSKKQAYNLRGDYSLNNGDSITYRLGYVDYLTYQPSGNRLKEVDYNNRPTLNYFNGTNGDAQSLRTSITYDRAIDATSSVTITPFYRDLLSTQVPNFAFTAAGTGMQENWKASSYGVMSRYYKDLDGPHKVRAIAGLDYEITNGSRISRYITTPFVAGSTNNMYYTWFPTPNVSPAYNYAAQYTSTSPYAQFEFNVTNPWRVFAGARYDTVSVDYTNNLSTTTAGSVIRPASGSWSWSRVNPKVGTTYQLTDRTIIFANYSEGFRTPFDADMFKPGASLRSTDLQPTVAINKEVGFRSWIGNIISYDVTVYQINKNNDILAIKDINNSPIQTDNGKTQHKGIELSWSSDRYHGWKTYGAYTWSQNQYVSWITNQITGANFNGKTMSLMPSTIGMIGVSYSPASFNGGFVAAEVTHFGSTYVDDANTWKYNGHDLLNLTSVYKVDKQFDLIGKITNVLDTKYALTYGGSAIAKEFEPGMPRAFYIGARYKF